MYYCDPFNDPFTKSLSDPYNDHNMKVNFYLQNPKAKASKIFLVSFIKKQRIKFYTTLFVPVVYWDKKRQRVKNTAKFPDAAAFNQYLDFLQSRYTEKYFEMMRSDSGPTIALMKRYLKEITFKIQDPNISLIDFWQKLIDKRTKSPAFSPGTVKTYVTARRHFIGFCKVYGPHSFDEIDLVFIERFKSYLFSKKLSINYVEKVVQQLRVMLNQAIEEDITTNTTFRKKAFVIKKTDTDEKYLSLDELAAIAAVNLEKHLSVVRDAFLIQSFCGVAYDDITKVKLQNIQDVDGVRVLSYYRGKTNKLAAIPIHPIIDGIMMKRDWQPFDPVRNQVYNRHLKKIAKAAGIVEVVEKKFTNSGIEKINQVEKWKLIFSHTGRRSFTTNFILSGGTKDEVKLMLGHLKQDVTETYIKAEMQKRAALLAARRFFSYCG